MKETWVTTQGRGKHLSHLVRNIATSQGHLQATTYCGKKIRSETTQPQFAEYPTQPQCQDCVKHSVR